MSWDELSGDSRSRFCSACGKDVYNIASLSKREVEELFARANDRICGRIEPSRTRLALSRTIGVAAFVTLSAFAQTDAPLSGVVKDSSGAPIPRAQVVLIGDSGHFEAVAGLDGRYAFEQLPDARYVLTIQSPGFESFRQPDLAIEKTSAVRLNAVLKVGSTGGGTVVRTRWPGERLRHWMSSLF